LYLKNGTWQRNNDLRAEQCVAYFLLDDIELVVFVNSPFTVVDTFTGELGRAKGDLPRQHCPHFCRSPVGTVVLIEMAQLAARSESTGPQWPSAGGILVYRF
jgi:hypothetical protein